MDSIRNEDRTITSKPHVAQSGLSSAFKQRLLRCSAAQAVQSSGVLSDVCGLLSNVCACMSAYVCYMCRNQIQFILHVLYVCVYMCAACVCIDFNPYVHVLYVSYV